jgi:hypothetical protein
MPINQEGYLLIIYSLNLNTSIVEDRFNIIGANLTSVKIFVEVLEYGVKQYFLVPYLELFLLIEYVMPFSPFLMDEIGVLERFLMHFVQLIELKNYFLLCLSQFCSQLCCHSECFDLKLYGKNLFPIH